MINLITKVQKPVKEHQERWSKLQFSKTIQMQKKGGSDPLLDVQELGQIAALDPTVFDQAKNQAKKSEITLRPGRVRVLLIVSLI